MTKEKELLSKKLQDVAIVVDINVDQVAVAKTDIREGTVLDLTKKKIIIKQLIKMGQRFALNDIRKGEFLRQYGYAFARSKGISQGDLIALSNIENTLPKASLKKFKPPPGTKIKKEYSQKTFSGFQRKDGRIGTRSYYLVVPTSMCISEIAFEAAENLNNNPDILRKYTNINGIVSIPHTEGCGCDSGLQIDRLMRVLRNYICHPNVGGCLILDLGCEQTNYEKMFPYLKDIVNSGLKPIDWLTFQKCGGTRLTIDKAKDVIKKRLPEVNRIKRTKQPLKSLVIGTECGASDSFSGITANHVIGKTVDKIIFGGGSAILSEIPEMVGAFQMLFSRFRDLSTAKKFNEIMNWYVNFAKKLGLNMNANLVPKNIEGGLINNYIKSLGAVIKGGSTPIEDVIDYAESVKKKGLSIMQGPGGDPESVTGIVASGSTIMCFSTGFGASTGSAICPVIKITSNTKTFEKLPEDMDFDAGRLLTSNIDIDALSEELLEEVIKVCSGKKTRSEICKQRQFQIWTAGKLPL